MLGLAGAVGEFMALIAEAAVEAGLGLAAQAALGVGVAAGAYVVVRKVRKKKRLASGDDPAEE